MLKAEHLKHQNLTSDSQCHKLQNKQQIFNRYIIIQHAIWASSWDYCIYHIGDQQGSVEPAHARILARAFAVCTHQVWKKTKGLTKHQISSPTVWLCMRVWRMSLRRSKSAIISWLIWQKRTRDIFPYHYNVLGTRRDQDIRFSCDCVLRRKIAPSHTFSRRVNRQRNEDRQQWLAVLNDNCGKIEQLTNTIV